MKKPLLIKSKFLTFTVLIAQLLLGISQTVYGQTTRRLEREDNTQTVEKRVALVIGNGDYLHAKSLPNPVNDAKDMTEKLQSLGFRVFAGTNMKKTEMITRIREFGEELAANGGVGLFFYAGHGVQFEGENYLIPVDADIKAEDEIDVFLVSIEIVLKKLATARNDLNIILLDACRDNPFAGSWKVNRSTGSDGGWAKMNAPRGTVLFYATAPGSVASDGKGRNGLFTSTLLDHISQPDLELSKFIKTVIGDVSTKSKNTQTPWNESSFAGDFYFVKGSKPSEIKTLDKSLSEERLNEENAWKEASESNDPEDFRFFLDEFPNGFRSQEAKNKIDQLTWDAAKKSNSKEKIKAYLDKFPTGLNSGAARITLRKIIERETALISTPKVENTTAETVLPKKENTEKNETATSTREIAAAEKTVTENKTATETLTIPQAEPDNPIIPQAKPDINETVSAETEKAALIPPRIKIKTTALKIPPARLPKVKSQMDNMGIELIFIPAGSFLMGASQANIAESKIRARKDYADFEESWITNETPAHKVEIAEPFWMGKTEITQEQWEKVMGINPSMNLDCAECPVERVSWDNAKDFIKKLNSLNNGFIYSLPTEAEWEYAARGGTPKLFAGNIDEISWHSGNSEGKTQSVATRFPNSFGLYDMNGNVAEWCEDLYVPYIDPSATGEATETKSRNLRVVRGGSWNVFPTLQRSTVRGGFSPTFSNIVTGFRVVARPAQ